MILGEAAHICAASQGGARYDRSMTSEQRKSASNGIWLCRKCARLIDADGDRFPTELLKAWKLVAETHARESLEPQPRSEATPGIDFQVRQWKAWRTRGNLPSDHFIIVSGYGCGDIQYQGQLYFRNNTSTQQLLTSCALQFHADRELIFTDEYAVRRQDIALPLGDWTSIYFNGGLHMPTGPGVYSQSDAVFFACDLVGVGPRLWEVATICGDATSLQEI